VKIIFLTGHRKSGTTLLSNLLDNVNGLCVYPTDLTLLYAYYPYFNNKKYSYKFKINRIKKIISNSFKTSNTLNKNFYKELNPKVFTKIFLKRINRRNIDKIDILIKLLMETYTKFYKKYNNTKINYFVFKETSCGYIASDIKKWFRNVKFIQIIRDPRDNYASIKSGFKSYYKNIGEDEINLLSSLINRVHLDFKYIDINKSIFGRKKYMIVKYENLVSSQNNVTKKICKFINIKYDKNIMVPTVLGKSSAGNNYEGIKFKKISNLNKNNWRNRISIQEAEIIEFYLGNLMKNFGYKLKNNIKNTNFLNKFYQEINRRFYFKDSYK
tara:strand:+ start:178 stop:1158 length:981 start_codon:yes stop_codon:yes gene_type:complete